MFNVFGIRTFYETINGIFIDLVFFEIYDTAFSMKKSDIFHIDVLVSWELKTKNVDEQVLEEERGRFFASVQPLFRGRSTTCSKRVIERVETSPLAQPTNHGDQKRRA